MSDKYWVRLDTVGEYYMVAYVSAAIADSLMKGWQAAKVYRTGEYLVFQKDEPMNIDGIRVYRVRGREWTTGKRMVITLTPLVAKIGELSGSYFDGSRYKVKTSQGRVVVCLKEKL